MPHPASRGGRPLTAVGVIDLRQGGGRREPSRSRGRLGHRRGDDDDDHADEPRRVEARRRGSGSAAQPALRAGPRSASG
eukprot:6701311-Pyramimonas_sp.AAC.1